MQRRLLDLTKFTNFFSVTIEAKEKMKRTQQAYYRRQVENEKD